MGSGRIAILDDEPAVREILGEFLRNRGYSTILCAEPAALEKELSSQPADLLICDLYLGDVTGLDVIRKLKPLYPALDIIVLTGFASIDNVIEAFRLGASDYMQKPVNLLLFEAAIERLLEKKRLTRQVGELTDIIRIHQEAERAGTRDHLPRLLELVAGTAVKAAGADAGAIVLFDEEGATMRVSLGALAGLSSAEADRLRNLSAAEVNAWLAKQANGSGTAEPVGLSPGASQSVLCIPFLQRGKIRGALEIVRRAADRPFTPQEAASTQVLAQNASLAIENARLYKSLEEGYLSSIRSLAKALEAKDRYTGGHSERVAGYSRMLADMTDLPEETKARLEMAALLHDIGKLGVSDYVLQKAGPLTNDERTQIMKHPAIGDEILSQVPSLAAERLWVYEHHERFDGTGYPRGVGGNEISLPGRILIMVEVYDALATERSYKKAWPSEMIADHFKEGRGKIYDPAATDLFLELLHGKLANNKVVA
ncbi:MAG: HD domain-containing phosphohydrolase [Bdellovibrionota bacterium]